MLRTISMRLRGISEDGEDLTSLTPELQKYFDAYGTGVKIMDEATGEFNSTYDILLKLSETWGDLTDAQRANLTELIAGKRQSDTLNAVLGNTKTLTNALTDSQQSFGSALQENAVYLESVQSKIDAIDASMEDLWTNSLNSETVVMLLEIANGFIEIADAINLVEMAITSPAFVALNEAILPKFIENLKNLENKIRHIGGKDDRLRFDITEEHVATVEKYWASYISGLKDSANQSNSYVKITGASYDYIAERIKKLSSEQAIASAEEKTRLAVQQMRLEQLKKGYDEAGVAVDNFQSNLSGLEGIYEELTTSEKISYNTILDLIQKYPALIDQISDVNDGKETGLNLSKAIFEANKDVAIGEIEKSRAEIIAGQQVLKLDLENYKLKLKLAEIAGINTEKFKKDYDSAYKAFNESAVALSLLTKQSDIIEGLNFDSFVAGIDSTKEKVEETVEDLKEEKKILEEQSDLYKEQEDLLSAKKDAIEDLIDLEENRIKQALEDQIDDLEKQKDLQSDLVDLVKDKLKAEKETNDFNDSIAEKQKEEAKLLSKINKLRLDPNQKGEVTKLEDELAKIREEIAKEQADREYDIRTDTLDKNLDAYDDAKDKEIEILKDQLDKEGELRAQAIRNISDAISQEGSKLYEELVSWNSEYGTGIETDIANAWDLAKEALSGYADVLSGLGGIDSGIARAQAIQKMMENSMAWFDASPEERKRLEEANMKIGTSMGWTRSGGVWYDQQGIRAYATGGVNTDNGIAMLHKNEMILNEGQIGNLFKFIKDYSSPMNIGSYKIPEYSRVGGNMTNSPIFSINISGNADKSTISKIQRAGENMIQDFYKRGQGRPVQTLG